MRQSSIGSRADSNEGPFHAVLMNAALTTDELMSDCHARHARCPGYPFDYSSSSNSSS